MTISQAKAVARTHGYTLRKNDDEYRMNIRDGDEATAYYTDDLDDAISTLLWEVENTEEDKKPTDTLTVTQKSNYGQTVFYPACDLARLFASIANTSTLTDRALRQIEDHGFKIEIESPTTKGWR